MFPRKNSWTPFQRALPLPQAPSEPRAVPKARVALAAPKRRKAGLRPPPSLRPSTTCLGLGILRGAARASQLRPRRHAPLFPAPRPRSDHVTLLQSPCPNFWTPSDHGSSTPSVGNRSRGPFRDRPAGTCYPARRVLRERAVRCMGGPSCPALPDSQSRSPALLLLLRAPLDRIDNNVAPATARGGRRRSDCWPASRSLYSTVSERFETPKLLERLREEAPGRREKVGKEER